MAFRHAYLHGFASSPLSTKGQAMRRFYASRGVEMLTPDLNTPSFGELTYSGMLGAVDALDVAPDLSERHPWRLMGSSMGGFVAARWAELNPTRVDRLILLCPAFGFAERWPELIGATAFERWRETGSMLMPGPGGAPVDLHYALVEDAATHPAEPVVPCPTLIIHGRADTVVPIDLSRAYAAAHPERVTLLEVDDDHLLGSSHAQIQAKAVEFLLDPDHTLYWDHFGATAKGTAEHFKIHLDEFLVSEGLEGCSTGVEIIEPERHAAAWCRCPEHLVSVIGRALRPRRVD